MKKLVLSGLLLLGATQSFGEQFNPSAVCMYNLKGLVESTAKIDLLKDEENFGRDFKSELKMNLFFSREALVSCPFNEEQRKGIMLIRELHIKWLKQYN